MATSLLSACGGTPGDGGDGAEARTLVPTTAEVLLLGARDGDSWEAFSHVVAVGFDADGNLYVLDAANRSLAVVDRSGGLVRMVGRAGDGPGEHRRPLAMAVLPDGRVVVSDAGHRTLTVFAPDGTVARAIPLGDGVAPPTTVFAQGSGAVVYAARPVVMGLGAGAAWQPPAEVPIRRVDLDADEEVVTATVHVAWAPPREPPRVSGSGGATMVRRTIRAFEPQLHLAVLPDGAVAVADSTTYRIRIVQPDGETERAFQRPVPPVEVTDLERETERARRLRELEAGGPRPPVTAMGPGGQAAGGALPRSVLETQLQDMAFWPEIQVIQRLAADRDGRLWVQRYGGVDEPGPIEILGLDGDLRATIPGGFPLPAAFGPDGLAAWIEQDDMDVPFVRVARLTGPP